MKDRKLRVVKVTLLDQDGNEYLVPAVFDRDIFLRKKGVRRKRNECWFIKGGFLYRGIYLRGEKDEEGNSVPSHMDMKTIETAKSLLKKGPSVSHEIRELHMEAHYCVSKEEEEEDDAEAA